MHLQGGNKTRKARVCYLLTPLFHNNLQEKYHGGRISGVATLPLRTEVAKQIICTEVI